MQNGTNLAAEMRAAWTERADRAFADLMAADMAPALFKPEWAELAMAEYTTARRELARWSA